MRSILVIQLKRIGDLILTLPALEALRTAWPEAKITLAIDGDTAGLLPALGCVDRVLIYRKRSTNLETFSRLALGSFDVAFDFTGTDRSLLLTGLSHAKRRVTFRWVADFRFRRAIYTDFVDSSVRERHTVDHHLDLLSAVGLTGADAELHLRLPESARGKIHKQPYIAVHVGAARAEKYWPAKQWAAVIDFCQSELRLPCILIGGNSAMEKEAIQEIRENSQIAPHDLSGQLSLMDSAALIAGAELFIGIDSGPSHLAAALQTSQITLFGPTNPFHWHARHPHSIVLQGGKSNPVTVFTPQSKGGELNDLSTPEVIHAINSLLPTRPLSPTP